MKNNQVDKIKNNSKNIGGEKKFNASPDEAESK